MAMDTKDTIRTESVLTAPINDGNVNYNQSSTTLQTKRNKSYQDIGSNSLGKVESQGTRPCAIIGPDRVLPPPPASDVYLKKASVEPWSCNENVYRPQTDFAPKLPEYQQVRNISPRQTFQENMQRIMVPPTYNSNKNIEDPHLKGSKDTPLEVKYCEVPYPVNHTINGQKSIRNSDIPLSSVNPAFPRTVPPHGWPNSVSARPVRPFGAPEYYQYPEFANYTHPRTIPRPLRTLHHDPAQVNAEHVYHEGNVRFKPYPTIKDRYPQARYEYGNNYPNQFHGPFPPQKFDLPKTVPPHPYPMYSQVPMRRIAEPIIDSYQRSNQPPNFNPYHNQYIPSPYGPAPGNCIQNKIYSHPTEVPPKPLTSTKLPYDLNNKIYLEYENNINKMYPPVDNMYYRDLNRQHLSKPDVAIPVHPGINMQYNMPPQYLYRKDGMPMKPFDNMPYRSLDQNVHGNSPMLRHPMQYSSGIVISPADSNASNETITTLGLQEDCGYVSQSSTASGRSIDSGNYRLQSEILRKHESFYTKKYTKQASRPDNSDKKGLDVRQFLQMWNEGEEEAADTNHASNNHFPTNSETISNQEQLYVLGLVNIPSEELSKYEHIQKISKLPENIKGYNSIELLDQYEQLVESPAHKQSKMTSLLDYQISPKAVAKPSPQVPRPVSPLDVEAKISQSVIHKEVGCNFEIKPCSPKMMNVEVATPAQNMLDERAIEKVMNIGLVNSPIHTNKPENVTSCKMNSPYVSNSDVIKSNNYSFQELESNSGICLASLPRLDSDIELNFPEINQQFIDANKLNTNNNDNLDVTSTHITQRTDVPECSVEKETSKLSKYRKTKLQETPDDKIHQCIVNRTDSVIIKNPDNVRNQEEIITSIATISNESKDTNNDTEYHANETSQDKSVLINSLDNNDNIALDFSLNRITENHKKETECINLPDLNTSHDLDKNHELCNPVDSVISTQNNNEVDNLKSEYDNINLGDIPETVSSPKDIIHTHTENNNGNENDIFHENILDDNEDHFESIEEEVENIKLKLPSLCVDNKTKKKEIKKFTDNSDSENIIEDKCKETEHEAIKIASTVIATANFSEDKNYSIDQRQNNDLSEIPDVPRCPEIPDIPGQSTNELINKPPEKEYSLEETTAIETSCFNESNSEIVTLPDNNFDHSIDTENDDAIQNNRSENSDVTNSEECNLNEPPDRLVIHPVLSNKNESNTESFPIKDTITNSPAHLQIDDVSTNPKDSCNCEDTVTNNNHINLEENLNQSTLTDVKVSESKGDTYCMEEVQDNNVNAEISPNLLDDKEVTSSMCSPKTEILRPEFSSDILEENENRITEVNTMNNNFDVIDHSVVDREPFKSENDNDEKISSQMLEIQDFIKEIKADMSSPILDIEPDCEFIPILTNENSIDIDEVKTLTNNNTIHSIHQYFYKELYSPRIQNLFLFNEGLCSPILNPVKTPNKKEHIDRKVEDGQCETPMSSNFSTTLVEKFDDIQSPEMSYVEEVNSRDNIINDEIQNLDYKSTQEEEILYVQQDQSPTQTANGINENCDVQKDNSGLLSTRRFTLKRSLSDSAIELYNGASTQEQIDVNNEFLSKRQKFMPNDLSDQTGEDFCSIVHNNRRNSISFSNSQNVFILIDNEYVIEEGDEDSDKICFAEVSSEFCNEADPILNLCVTNDNEEDLIPETYTCDSLEASGQSQENKTMQDAWNMDCEETIFNDDVAQDIIISAPSSPGNCSLDPNDEEGSANSDSETEHMMRIKEIYGDKMCTNDVQLVETLYNMPQMDVNKTLVDIESQYLQDTFEDPMNFSELEKTEDASTPVRLNNSCVDNKIKQLNETENQEETLEVECSISVQNETGNYQVKHQDTDSDCVVDSRDFRDTEYVRYNNKENDLSDSLPSSPEVSSTTSEEKCSSILLKITSVNGSRTSQINNSENNTNRVSYKLTEAEDYSTNYRPLITKAAKKYIPPLKESQDLRVKLPLPQQSLDKLKRLKMTKNKPVVDNTKHRTNHIRHDIPKKIKPKFEDVLRSIDEIQFKMKREKTKKIKHSIPKVVIKKNENGAHYASTPDRKPNYNPDLTGRKWQPWVFIERNEFVDKMAQRNKVKAVYCHRKKTYVLADKFKKYKSICTAKFVISQPNSDSASAGNLKYTIKLKHNY